MKNNNNNSSIRDGGAAYTITEECERLFCETLKTVFLGEGNLAFTDSLAMGARIEEDNDNDTTEGAGRAYKDIVGHNNNKGGAAVQAHQLMTPEPSPGAGILDLAGQRQQQTGFVDQWVEIWDYAGGLRFRGFIAEKNGERALSVFFSDDVVGKDLKHGLMALLELSAGDDFECTQLVVCLDRRSDPEDISDLSRDLGWVGFSLMTLDGWSEGKSLTSDRWIFLGMDV